MPGLSLNGRRYELRKLPLAQGGMGEVWLGHDNRLQREVVVKFLRVPPGAEDEEHIRRRFEREAMITARLEHPGVPAIYDVGYDDDTPYMVMQRIRGLTVADLIVEQRPDVLPIGWIAAIGAQICSVLAAAHGDGLIHRDLKPSNVMLEPHGAVKVLDFGLATAPSDADLARITQMGVYLGTPAYMAPEQVQSNNVDPATDLYALGCSLYEMLTGAPLFTGPTPFSLMTQQVNEAPPPPRTRRSDVPSELERLVMQLLEKKPDARPASAEDVYELLLPLCVDLGPLPGALDPPSMPSPARMYAGVLHRVFATTTAPEQPPTAALHAQEELRRAQSEARSLVQRNRPGEAAAVLKEALQTAQSALDDADADVISARYEWAKLRFEAADYEGADPTFQALAELAAGSAAMSDLEFDCRYKAAMCDALLDRHRQAMERIESLLADYRLVHGDTDQRALRLRRHLGQLQLNVGEHQAAKRTFEALLEIARSTDTGLDPDEIAETLATIPDGDVGPSDPGWQDVLRYADLSDPAMSRLVAELSGRGVTAPVIGYELGDEGWLTELAWPIRTTAITVKGTLDHYELIERDEAYRVAGWDARPAGGWTADEIIGRVMA